MSSAYVDPWDMLNNFCFHVNAQKSVFVSERPYPDFSSTSYGRTIWGQSSVDPCRTMPNRVRQQRTATKYGNEEQQKRTANFRRQYLGNGLSDLHETLTVFGPHLCSKSVKF